MHLSFALPLALLLFPVLAILSLAINHFSRTYLPPARRRVSMGLRLVLIALIALALAQPRLAVPQNALNVVFLVDASDSVGSAGEEQATQWIRQALTHLGPQDRAGVVVFGQDALVETALAHQSQLPDLASAPVRSHTDIAGAIRLGMAMLAGNGGKRLVLLSDGNENLEAAADEARIAALSGVEISTVPIVRAPHPNIYVDHVAAPNTLRKDEKFDVSGSIQSTVAGSGTLYLFTDGALTAQQPITLKPGANSFSFAHDALTQGFHTFSVQLETSADATTENKRASTFAYVTGAPRVLIAEGQPGVAVDVSKALTASGMQVDTVADTAIPADLAQLRSYDSVVLVNVPATDLPASTQQELDLYVKNLGGGLVTIGGDKAYASGQYENTALDALLPVSSEVAPRKNLPSTAVVFIIESLENSLGIDISKEAAKAAIGYLSSADEVAVNDTSGGWAVPLQHVTDKAAIDAKIDAMSPSDPASYAPALQDAAQALASSPAKTKHIILMGDGDAADSYQTLVQGIAASGITVSVVGTNVQPSDLGLLQDIANWGKGRYYDGNDPFDIPNLLTKETQLVARPAIVEGAFTPSVVGSPAALRGIPPSSLPALTGYTATTLKPTAQVELLTNEQDPLLAEWQNGLGHVVAWTSDAGARWAANWVTWPRFAAFWSQAVRESLPSDVDQNLQVSLTATGQGAHVTVDAVSADRSYRNFLKTDVMVVNPQGQQTTLHLEQTGPGRYEGDLPTPDQGTYLLQVVQTDDHGQVVASQPNGYSIDYSPEYRESGVDDALLQSLAQVTQGKVFTSPDQAFRHDLQGASEQIVLWPWLLGIALFIFLADVGTRRLRLSGRDVALAWQKLRRPQATTDGRLAGLRQRMQELRAQGREQTGGQTLAAGRLRGRQQTAATEATVSAVAARLRQQRGQPPAPAPSPTAARPPLVAPPERRKPPSAVEAAAAARRQPRQPVEAGARSAPAPSGSTHSRLLEAKQRARQPEDE